MLVRRRVLDRALAVLNSCLRLAKGRKQRPPAGILDAQSVRAGPQRGPRGYDAGKRVKGRKRVLLVDTQGLVQVLEVVPASAQDRDAVASVEPCLAKGTLLKVWADRAFNGKTAAAPIIRHGIDLELVGRKIKTGFAGRAQAMVGRGNLGILVRYRRLLVDHEGSLTCLVT